MLDEASIRPLAGVVPREGVSGICGGKMKRRLPWRSVFWIGLWTCIFAASIAIPVLLIIAIYDLVNFLLLVLSFAAVA